MRLRGSPIAFVVFAKIKNVACGMVFSGLGRTVPAASWFILASFLRCMLSQRVDLKRYKKVG